MGWFGKKALPPPPPPPFDVFKEQVLDHYNWSQATPIIDCLSDEVKPWVSAELSVFEAAVFAGFCGFFLLVSYTHATTPMKKTAVLNMPALNRVNIFKECFLGYVNAGMLEPIMAIASSDYDVTTRSLLLNTFQLLGLFSWLYLLSDAFDISDTQQAFVYQDRIRKDKQDKDMPDWLKKAKKGEGDDIRKGGSLFADMALWFMLACSFAAFTGVVSHRDVIHSHSICILWAILHHMSRRATAWRGTGYFHTLFAPSAALLPLEYCLNLIDQEMIGDDGLEDLETWRAFIKDETGVELTIVA